jgi:hypothetical protein
MKYLKMLGLAAIAALALAAFGASSASATVLCSTKTSPCTGTKYGAGTTLHAVQKSGTKPTLTTSITTVTCDESTIHGHVTNGGSSSTTVTGEITKILFTKCQTSSGTACTVTETTGPWHAELHYGGTVGNGTLTVKKAAGEDPGATVVCGSLINCKFTTSLATLNVTGGGPAIVAAKNISLARSGGICPETATWNAEYEVKQPNPLYVAAS